MWRILILAVAITLTAGQCQFDEAVLGNWTSTNYGTLIFSNSTPQFVMSVGFILGETSTGFDCYLNNGTIYILKSTTSYNPLDDAYVINIYMCLDLRKAGDYSYYYYQHTAKNGGLQGERVKPFVNTKINVAMSDVCTTTLDPAEFNTMVKQGFEREAAVQCADPLLASATYTYTDAVTTYCAGLNTTLVDSCNQNLTYVQFNDSVVSDTACQNKNPGFSVSGNLGCVANVYDSNSNQHYVSLYNYDSASDIDGTTIFQFTCVAVTTDENGTVFLSMVHTACEAGQNSTVLPTNGALMELTPFGVPIEPTDSGRNWTWLIVLCVLLFLLLVAILVAILICLHVKKKQREKAREKKILITEEHPLAEVSMPIDAPNSMEPITDTAFFENREDLFRTPRGRKKEKAIVNPMSESSLILDFKSPRWSIPKAQPTSQYPDDPFSEMSNGNGEIVPISPVGSKTVRSMLNKQRSFSTAFLEEKSSPLKNGGLQRHASVGMISERSFVKSERSFVKSRATSQRTAAPQTPKPERSFKAPSRRPSKINLQNQEAISTKAHSVAAAPNVAPSFRSVKSNRSNKSNKTAKSNPVPAEKPKSAKRPGRKRGVVSTKLGRSTTSTKLGSVTQRENTVKKDSIRRSKTVFEPTLQTIAKAKEGEKIVSEALNEFLAAETGSSISGNARPTKASPRRKSILKRTSAYLPLDLAEEQQETDNFPTVPPRPSHSHDGVLVKGNVDSPPINMSSSFGDRDSFLGLKAKQNLSKPTRTPIPSKSAWH